MKSSNVEKARLTSVIAIQPFGRVCFFGADLYDMPWMVDEMSTREPEHDLENELILALKNPSVSRPTCLRSDLYSYGR